MRPASEMLLIVAVGGFACTWWFHRDGFRFWRGIAANLGIFIAGTLIVLAPWLKELHDREGTIGQLTVFNVMKDRSEILHPSSLHLVGWYNNTLFQDRLFADMDIQAPFRPYIRGNSVFSGFIFSQPEILWADDRYPGESTRESIRHSPGLYWRHVLYSTYYHAFFRMLQGYPFRAQSDILGWFMVSEMTRPRQSGAATVAELSAELDRLTRNPDQSGPPEQQRALERLVSTMIDRTPLLQNHSLANAALWPATVAGKIWPAAILLAVFSFVVALVLRPLRPMLVLSVLVSLTIFYHSLMGFANERYMVVIEPLVYVLAALVAYGLLCLKLKRIHPC